MNQRRAMLTIFIRPIALLKNQQTVYQRVTLGCNMSARIVALSARRFFIDEGKQSCLKQKNIVW